MRNLTVISFAFDLVILLTTIFSYGDRSRMISLVKYGSNRVLSASSTNKTKYHHQGCPRQGTKIALATSMLVTDVGDSLCRGHVGVVGDRLRCLRLI